MDGSALREWTRTNVQRAPKADSSSEHTAVDINEASSAELPRAPIGKVFSRKSAARGAADSSDEHTNVDVTEVESATGVEGTTPGKDTGENTSPRAIRRALGKRHRQAQRAISDSGENTQIRPGKGAKTMPEFAPHSIIDEDSGGFRVVAYDDYEGPITTGLVIANRYRLDTQIGTGGFGVVFDAFDQEEQQRVAVKLLSPALASDRRTLMRFRREAIAASRVRHPGIVNIIDFGIGDDEFSYIVMEFLSGQDLEALLGEEGMVEPKRALRLAIHCARALSAAHSQGVFHRDLKPANIFLIKDEDDNEQIKIIDFGIAKDKNSNPRTGDLTSASKVVGTPYYMSPEQARGKELDGRADLYSLGVILFEMLTGRRPFEGSTAFDILMAHSQKERTAPSDLKGSLGQIVGLDELVLKAIAVKRGDRYESMNAFAEALERCLSQAETGHLHKEKLKRAATPQPIVAGWRASTVLTEPGYVKTKKRNMRLWVAAVPAVALLIAGIIFFGSEDKSKAASPPPLGASPSESVRGDAKDAPPATPGEPAPTAAKPVEAPEEVALDEHAAAPDPAASGAKAKIEMPEATVVDDAPIEAAPSSEPPKKASHRKRGRKSSPKKRRRRHKPKGISEW